MKCNPLLLAITLGGWGCAAEPPRADRDEAADVSCPSIACNSSIEIKANLTLSLEEAKQRTFEVCVNDDCAQGRLAADAKPALPGVGVGLSIDAEFGAGDLFFYQDADGREWLRLSWRAQTEESKQDGDRYRVRALMDDGSANVLFEERVDYEARTTAPLPCPITCLGLNLDLRTR